MTEANTNININVDEIEKTESSENEVKESQAKPNIRRGNEIKDWVKSIIIAAFIAVLLMQLIVPTVVREHSMEPSFYGGDYLIVGKISYKLTDPKRGDVIIFKSDIPMNPGEPSQENHRIAGRCHKYFRW